MCKESVFLNQLVFPYLPDLFPTAVARGQALAYPKAFDVNHLTEIALAKVGGYTFVDEKGYDFDDLSDSKTTSLNAITKRFEIGSMENKIGAIRISCYNLVLDTIDYFFVPANELEYVVLPCYGKCSHKKRLMAQYNPAKGHYNQFEDYRVKDFVTLATASGGLTHPVDVSGLRKIKKARRNTFDKMFG